MQGAALSLLFSLDVKYSDIETGYYKRDLQNAD